MHIFDKVTKQLKTKANVVVLSKAGFAIEGLVLQDSFYQKGVIYEISIIMIICPQMLFIIFFVPLFACSQPQTLNQIKDKMEDIVLGLAKIFQANYSDWCLDGIATCQSLSYIGCKGYKAKSCDKGFNKPSICLSDGALMSQASNLNFPSYMNLYNLSQEDIRFICSSAKLQKHFRQIGQKREKRFTYLYIGSNQGVFRLFPGEKFDCQNSYDPRTKPWYSFSVSGVKNVVFLLDKGSSTKLNDIKQAANSIVDVLSINDFVGVIDFDDKISMFGNHRLIPGTNANKEYIKMYINNLTSAKQHSTDFEAALIAGFKTVNESEKLKENGCSNPENIFVIFTYGGPDASQQVAPLIQRLQQFLKDPSSKLKRATILIYTIGAIANPLYLKELTCIFNGTVFETPEKTSISQKRKTIAKNTEIFYQYLSSGLDVTEPRWTSSYKDYFTGEEQYTVSMPVYSKNQKSKLKNLVGVIGMNVFLNYETQTDRKNAENTFISESICQGSHDACKVESLRPIKFQCNLKTCQNMTNQKQVCHRIFNTSDIFINDDITRTDRICCGFTKVEFGLLLGFLLGFGVILMICLMRQINRIILCYRNWKIRRDYDEVQIIQQTSSNKKQIEKAANKSSDLSKSEQILEEFEKRQKDRANNISKIQQQKEEIEQ